MFSLKKSFLTYIRISIKFRNQNFYSLIFANSSLYSRYDDRHFGLIYDDRHFQNERQLAEDVVKMMQSKDDEYQVSKFFCTQFAFGFYYY